MIDKRLEHHPLRRYRTWLSHGQDHSMLEILDDDCGAAVIAKGDNRSDNQLKPSLGDLQLHRVGIGTVLSCHSCSVELRVGLREVDLEAQVRSPDIDAQLPSVDGNDSEVSTCVGTDGGVIEKWSNEVPKVLGMVGQLLRAVDGVVVRPQD